MKKILNNALMSTLIAFYATGMVVLVNLLPRLVSDLVEEDETENTAMMEAEVSDKED